MNKYETNQRFAADRVRLPACGKYSQSSGAVRRASPWAVPMHGPASACGRRFVYRHFGEAHTGQKAFFIISG